MEKFCSLPRYPFTRAMIEYAPDGCGVYGLFDGEELIYIGRAARDGSIRISLAMHLDGALGLCTTKATKYTWELSLWPSARETELLDGFGKARGRDPRCQSYTAG